jgi:anti-sigma-K factor RskA
MDQARLMLIANADPDQTLQLSNPELEMDADTPDWLTVQIPPGAQNFAAVGVSIEPVGGSPTPTGPIVLLGASS